MEIWVLVIIAIRSKLDESVKRAERKIMKIALNPTIDALKQSAIISDLINNKNMLVNLKVLYDRISDALQSEKMDFLTKIVSLRDNVDAYCFENKTTPGAIIEKIHAYTDEGAMPLRKLGITVGKLQDDYGDLPLVALSQMTIKRIVKQIKTRTSVFNLAMRKNSQFSHVAL